MATLIPAWQPFKISVVTEDLLFPERLYLLLQQDTTGITEWFENGTGFRINNKADFTHVLIPKYFKLTKFLSFTRQMNVYGFQRVADPKPGFRSKYCYTHQYFCRDHPDLLTKMDRRKSPSRMKNTARKPQTMSIASPSLAVTLQQHGQSISTSNLPSENLINNITEELHQSLSEFSRSFL